MDVARVDVGLLCRRRGHLAQGWLKVIPQGSQADVQLKEDVAKGFEAFVKH